MSEPIKYHLGCGGCYLSGYLNVDFPQDQHPVNIVHADLFTDILKMSYQPAAEIRSRHFFEHFGYVDGMVLLYKWTKALVNGGTLVIDLPDMEALAKAMVHACETSDVQKMFKVSRYLYGSHEANWAYHINGWSASMLRLVLTSLGYDSVQETYYGSYKDAQPNCGVEVRATLVNNDVDLKKECVRFLGMYRNGESDFENRLWRLFESKFLELI